MDKLLLLKWYLYQKIDGHIDYSFERFISLSQYGFYKFTVNNIEYIQLKICFGKPNIPFETKLLKL